MAFRHRDGTSVFRRHQRNVNRDPLRKIIGEEYRQIGDSSASALFEKLECGHYQLPVSDLVGITNAYRRRCRQCGYDLRKASE